VRESIISFDSVWSLKTAGPDVARLGRRHRQCDNPRETLTEMQAACDTCHRRKSRCNKVKPRCGFCAKSNSDCTYSHRSRDPSTRREHVEGIERRLRQEEAKNQALISEIARLKSLAASRDREDCDTSQDVIQVRFLNLDNMTNLASDITGITCHFPPRAHSGIWVTCGFSICRLLSFI
jgi:hypothetical protein